MQIAARTQPAMARASAPQNQPAPTPEPPAAEDNTERYVKTAIHLLDGVACIGLGRMAAGPLGLVAGAAAGATGGAGYGHVADIFANALNPGTFQEHYRIPGTVTGAVAGMGAAYLASGNPALGLALGVGCSVPCFLSAYRAYQGLE